MLRFSLGSLLAAVLVVAVGCAALVHPTPLWSQIVFTATLVLLLSATVLAVVARPQPFASGLTIFGWGYLLLTSGPWSASVRPHLLTETALAKLSPLVTDPNDPAQQVIYASGVYGSPTLWGGGSTIWTTSTNLNTSYVAYPTLTTHPVMSEGVASLHQIGHALWANVFGVIGGAVGRYAAWRKTRSDGLASSYLQTIAQHKVTSTE
jgi:hypothetical protein